MGNLINEIDSNINEGKDYVTISAVVCDLVICTRKHFAFEESLLLKNQCPDFQGHQKGHIVLLKELTDWQEKLKDCSNEQLRDLAVMLRLWFHGHILSTDKKHAQYLKVG